MAIHVRMKRDVENLLEGMDIALAPMVAKELRDSGSCWVIGGDPADFEACGLSCDENVPPGKTFPVPPSSAEVKEG